MDNLTPTGYGFNFPHFKPLNFKDYRNYLPTAYDSALDTQESLLQVLNFCNEIGLLNQNMSDNWNMLLGWIKTNGIDDAVSAQLNAWVVDGTMATILDKTALQAIRQEVNYIKDKQVTDKASQDKYLEDSIATVMAQVAQLSFGVKGSVDTEATLTTKFPNGDNGFYVTLDTQHLYFWDPSTSKWTDLGGFSFGLPQLQESYQYTKDQENFFKNADLLIPNQTEPYEPISNNVDVNYIPPIDGFSWVQIVGHADETPFKGVRVESKVNSFPERYWLPTDLDFILRNDSVGDAQFHLDMVINQTNGGQIVKRVADFIGSNSVNRHVSVTAPSPQMSGAQQGNISSLFYQIWTDQLQNVKFRVTGLSGKQHLDTLVIAPDPAIAKDNLLGQTDVMQGADNVTPYITTTPAQDLKVTQGLLGKNWVTSSGTDSTTTYKGIAIGFNNNDDAAFSLDKQFIALALTASTTNTKAVIAVQYMTNAGVITKTLDTKIVLNGGITELSYTVPSPASLGIAKGQLNGGRISLTMPDATNFNLSVTDFQLRNIYETHSNIFKKDTIILDEDNNFNGSAWVPSNLAKSLEYANDKLTSYFNGNGTADYRSAMFPFMLTENQKNQNIAVNIELTNGDPASQQFMLLAKYSYSAANGNQELIVPIKKSISVPLQEPVTIKDAIIPSALSQGIPANVATTITLMVTVGNEANLSVAFWIGDTTLKLLPENEVKINDSSIPVTLTPKDMVKMPTVLNGKQGYLFKATPDAATWRGSQINYGVRDDDVYQSDTEISFNFVPTVAKINQLLLTAQYYWTDAAGNRQVKPYELLHYLPVIANQDNLIENIFVPSAKSMGVPNEYTSNPIVTIVANTNSQDDNDLAWFVSNISVKKYTDELQKNTSLPIIKLTGDFDSMTKDKKVTMIFKFITASRIVTGYSKTAWQGDSSLEWPAKNLRLQLYSDAALTSKMNFMPDPSYPSTNKFNLKVNWIQPHAARNLVTAQLAKEMTVARTGLPAAITTLHNYGQIQGVPCLVYINGSFYSLATLNTTKDVVTSTLDNKDKMQFAIEGTNGTPANMFKADTGTITGTAPDFDFTGTDATDTDIQASINALLAFVNSSTDTSFHDDFGIHYDLQSAIDWLLLTEAAGLYDNQAKNTFHVTFDGKKFYPIMYDLDGSFGNSWNGTDKFPDDAAYLNNSSSQLLNRLCKAFPNEIKTRYQELVSKNILDANHIQDLFKDFVKQVGEENYELDQKRWPDKHAYQLFTLDQTMQNIKTRLDNLAIRVNSL